MGCNCGKPKCDGKCGISPAVLQITNPSECVLFHKVTITSAMGNEITIPPAPGAYRNTLLYYEATGNAYFYSSDGIPTLISFTDYLRLLNKPSINGVTLVGDKTLEDLGIRSGDVYEIETYDSDQNYRVYKNGVLISDAQEAYNAISGATAQEIRWRNNPSAVFYHKCPGSTYGMALNLIWAGGEHSEECGSQAVIGYLFLYQYGGCSFDAGGIPFKTQLFLPSIYDSGIFVPNGTYRVSSNNPVIAVSSYDSNYKKLQRCFLYGEPDPSVVLTVEHGQSGHTLVVGDVDVATEGADTVIKMSLMSVANQEIYTIIFREDSTYTITDRYKITTTV